MKDIVAYDGYGTPNYLCKSWLDSWIISTGYIVVVAIFIALMNIIITGVLSKLAKFEGKHTRTKIIKSSMLRMFILQFINIVRFAIDFFYRGL